MCVSPAAPLPTVGIAVGTAAGIAGVLLVAAAAFLVRKRRGRGAKEQAEDRVGQYDVHAPNRNCCETLFKDSLLM